MVLEKIIVEGLKNYNTVHQVETCDVIILESVCGASIIWYH